MPRQELVEVRCGVIGGAGEHVGSHAVAVGTDLDLEILPELMAMISPETLFVRNPAVDIATTCSLGGQNPDEAC